MGDKLTEKQKAFCREYMIDLNATQAAIRAGYSEKTAKDIGCQNLAKPDIQEYLQELLRERESKVLIDAEYVLRRLKEIDELDIIDIMTDDLDGFRPLSEWPKSWRTSISGIDMQTIISGGDEPIEKFIKKIKWPDKVKNLEMIGKHVSVKAWEESANTQVDDIIQKVQIEVVSGSKD